MYSITNNAIRRLFAHIILVCGMICFCALAVRQAHGQGGGGGVAGGSPFRILRSVAGPSGTEKNGHLIIDDPRTVFYLGQDHKVVVYFEWEGPIGPHKFEGLWKNTDGKLALISDFQYSPAAKQFSGYWTMILSGSETPGLWTLEARIDGESAGELSFQLVAGANASPPPAPVPVPQPLPTSELYKKMAAVTVYVDKMDAQGKAVARGSGFYLEDGRLITAFQNIDGATKLRVISPNGASQEVSGVLAWNRWQDWAVLATGGPKITGLPRAASKSWSVGSLGYILESTSGSGRIIADGTIVGENNYPRAGDRLNIASRTGRAAVGSPLINEFAQVMGMVGGSLAPGTDMLDSYALAATPSSFGPTLVAQDGAALPIDLIPASTGQETSTSLGELANRGQFLKFLSGQDKVLFGELALTLETSKVSGRIASPADPRQQFSHADQKMYVFINWNIREKFKGFTAMAIYNADNKEIAQSPPRKLDLRPGEIASNTWDVPVASMPVGIYRVDVTLGDDIVWRRFFRVVE